MAALSAPIEIVIAGRRLFIRGDPADPDLAHLPQLAAGLAPLLRHARAVLPERPVIFDVGANLGLVTLGFAAVFPAARIFAFEPSPRNADLLAANLAANGVAATILRRAVGAAAGEAGFTEVAGFPAGSHLDAAGTLRVPLTSLDDFAFAEAALERVDFVKIDAEGAEPAILAGAARLIERFRPLLYMEFNSWCLMGLHGVDPLAFAHDLYESFAVSLIGADGTPHPAAAEAREFVRHNIALHGSVTDVLLRLRPGAAVPALPARARDPEALRLAAELVALRRSRSWRVTAPLRALGRLTAPLTAPLRALAGSLRGGRSG